MKLVHLFSIFLLLLVLKIAATENSEERYQRFLKDFEIIEKGEAKVVQFTLDNGWQFICLVEARDEHKLSALPRLIDTRVAIATDQQLPGLKICFENPKRKGCDKVSFQGMIVKESLENTLFLTDIQINSTGWFSAPTFFTLSDGSKWKIDKFEDLTNTLTPGDHILVIRDYQKFLFASPYTIINLDSSEQCFYLVKYSPPILLPYARPVSSNQVELCEAN